MSQKKVKQSKTNYVMLKMENPLNPSNADRYLSAVQFGLLRAMNEGVKIKLLDCPDESWKDTLFLLKALEWAEVSTENGTMYSIAQAGREQVANARKQLQQMTETFGIFQFVCLDSNIDAPTFAYANFGEHDATSWEKFINTEYEPAGFAKQKLFGDYRFAVVDKKHGKAAGMDWIINQTLFSKDPTKSYFRIPVNDSDLGEINFDLLSELIYGGSNFPGIEGVVASQYKWTDITASESGFNSFIEDAASILLQLHQSDKTIAEAEQRLAEAEQNLSNANDEVANAEESLQAAEEETETDYYVASSPVIWTASMDVVLVDWYFGWWYPSPYWGQAWVIVNGLCERDLRKNKRCLFRDSRAVLTDPGFFLHDIILT